jgi:hypothetical protein
MWGATLAPAGLALTMGQPSGNADRGTATSLGSSGGTDGSGGSTEFGVEGFGKGVGSTKFGVEGFGEGCDGEPVVRQECRLKAVLEGWSRAAVNSNPNQSRRLHMVADGVAPPVDPN